MGYKVVGSTALQRGYLEENNRYGRKEKTIIKHAIPVKEKLLYLFIVISCVAISCVIIGRYSDIAESNYRVQTLKHEMKVMQEDNNYLRLQVAEKSSPERILSAAQKMGMVRNEDNIIASYGVNGG